MELFPPTYMLLVQIVLFPALTEVLKRWSPAAEIKRVVALGVSVLIAAGGLLLGGTLTWESLLGNWALVYATGTLVYQTWSKGGETMTKLIAPAVVLLFVLSLVACGTTTTYNITFQTGAFRVAEELQIEPGQGGDDGSSTTSGETAGGTESSPGGSNLLRGFAQQGNIFQIGTASKPQTEATVDAQASATVQSPNSTTGTEGVSPESSETP